jgi:TolB-like protein
VKILDFGLAKLARQTKLTKTGTTVGTVAYMSPEQARGENIDHRTDIWSLGVVLYEMLAGKPPFAGEYDQAVIYSILNEEQEPVTTYRADIPAPLTSVISKALQKDSTQRYQTVLKFGEDLKKAETVTFEVPKEEKSIVVLPFENLSPDSDQEYFSDGLTEEIITDLSAVSSLRVISRGSAMTFKGTKKTIPEITRQVNVQYVLEGSVRKAGNNLRITAQLIDAQNDTHLWAEKYAGTLDDVFDIQEKVSRSIVHSLKLKLTPEEDQKIKDKSFKNIQAYECYTRARQELWKCTEDSLERALQYLRNGLDAVGENALLIAAMGNIYFQYYNLGLRTDEIYLIKAEEKARRALDIDPTSPHSHLILGLVALARTGAREAYPYIKSAYQTAPNDSDIIIWYTFLLQGFFAKTSVAAPIVQRCIEIDPLTPSMQSVPAFYHWMEGRFELALEIFKLYHDRDPENSAANWYYIQMLAWNNRHDEMFSLVDKWYETNPKDLFCRLSLLLKYCIQKNQHQANDLFKDDVRKIAWNDFMLPWYIAGCYSLLDEKVGSIPCQHPRRGAI